VSDDLTIPLWWEDLDIQEGDVLLIDDKLWRVSGRFTRTRAYVQYLIGGLELSLTPHEDQTLATGLQVDGGYKTKEHWIPGLEQRWRREKIREALPRVRLPRGISDAKIVERIEAARYGMEPHRQRIRELKEALAAEQRAEAQTRQQALTEDRNQRGTWGKGDIEILHRPSQAKEAK